VPIGPSLKNTVFHAFFDPAPGLAKSEKRRECADFLACAGSWRFYRGCVTCNNDAAMSALSPITEEDIRLFLQPPIAAHMPLRFRNGAVLRDVAGHCDACGHGMRADVLRGTTTRQTESVVAIRAIGVCPRCHIATRFVFRIDEALAIVMVRDGKWMRWHARVDWWPVWKHRLIGFVQNRLGPVRRKTA